MTAQMSPPRLIVSRFDRVTSALVTALILVGSVVAGLLVVFFSVRLYEPPKSVPVVLASAPGHGIGSLGEEFSVEPPAPDEALDPATFQPTMALSLVTEAINQRDLQVGQPSLTDRPLREGRGARDSRRAGSGGPGERVARPQRWELRFEGGSLNEYAAQLDFFGVELGVVRPTGAVGYASRFLEDPPVRRTGQAADEARLYMTWRSGDLKDADRELLRRAGVAAGSLEILQF